MNYICFSFLETRFRKTIQQILPTARFTRHSLKSKHGRSLCHLWIGNGNSSEVARVATPVHSHLHWALGFTIHIHLLFTKSSTLWNRIEVFLECTNSIVTLHVKIQVSSHLWVFKLVFSTLWWCGAKWSRIASRARVKIRWHQGLKFCSKFYIWK